MYSSVAEAEAQFRRSRSEDDSHATHRGKTPPASETEPLRPEAAPVSAPVSAPVHKSGLSGILSRIREDDLLILGILFLLLNENADDDPLILIVLAALLLN